jgi:uncharacterized membrane protein
MDAKKTIIGALMEVSEGADGMVLTIAEMQADQILSDLSDDGFKIVRKDETEQMLDRIKAR